MESIRQEISEGIERVIAEACPAEQVHAIERGGDHLPLWQALEASGFLDALVPEAAGGFGLSLDDAAPIAEAAGQHAVPVPLAETMVLRGLLAGPDGAAPAGAIAFGGEAKLDRDRFICRRVVEGARADHVLAHADGEWRCLPVAAGSIEDADLEATLIFTRAAVDAAPKAAPVADPLLAEALTRSLQIAGAMTTTLDRTLSYANDRQQFGRAIGKFQAIQHQLSVLAEHVFAGGMAVSVAASDALTGIDPLRVAIAKARSGEAAAEVAAIAHSIHGAIGFTREYDLQLLTRRLNAWRRAAGGESYWHQRAGRVLLEHPGPTLDLLRFATEGRS